MNELIERLVNESIKLKDEYIESILAFYVPKSEHNILSGNDAEAIAQLLDKNKIELIMEIDHGPDQIYTIKKDGKVVEVFILEDFIDHTEDHHVKIGIKIHVLYSQKSSDENSNL